MSVHEDWRRRNDVCRLKPYLLGGWWHADTTMPCTVPRHLGPTLADQQQP